MELEAADNFQLIGNIFSPLLRNVTTVDILMTVLFTQIVILGLIHLIGEYSCLAWNNSLAQLFVSFDPHWYNSGVKKKYHLSSDPQCGLTTGGREECWWDCQIEYVQDPGPRRGFYQFITNPLCLSDCYPPGHCLSSLLADYEAQGRVQSKKLKTKYSLFFFY